MKTTKLLVVLIISLLSVSLFSGFVFASQEGDDEKADDDKEKELPETVDSADSVDNDAVEKPVVADKNAVAKAKSMKQSIEERVSKKKDLLERAKKSREEAREALKSARDELKDARQKFRESKKALSDVRSRVEKCSGINSDECKKARKDNKAHVAKFVDGSVEQVYRMLERAKNAAQSSALNEEDRNRLVSELEAKLAELSLLRQKQGQIQAQSSASDVKNAAKNMKEFWNASKISVKKNNLKVSSGKLGNLVQNMEKLQERLNDAVAEFRSGGKDTAELDSKIVLFNEKVSASRSLNDELQALLESVDSASDKSAVMRDATGKMQQAQSLLKDARAVLNEIRESIKVQNALSAGIQQ